MAAHTSTLFSFAGIAATLAFSNFDAVEGRIEASGFDAGGEYANANIAFFIEDFYSPATRDMAVANAMAFVAAEMRKQAAWQAA